MGAPNYMDPLLYSAHEKGITDNIKCDLFKNDIFSLGLTLIEIALG